MVQSPVTVVHVVKATTAKVNRMYTTDLQYSSPDSSTLLLDSDSDFSPHNIITIMIIIITFTQRL